MPTTGTQFVAQALKEIQVLDPEASVSGTRLEDGILAGTHMIGSWGTQRLFVRGVTRSVYSLVSDQDSYTIGDGGNFDQNYPESIVNWSVIPDDDATDVVEIVQGRPLTWDQWQAISVKSTTGSYPTRMWYDRAYSSGLGNCLFYPVPDNGDVDVVLYGRVPQITSLVAGTSYDLPPGYDLAIVKNLALQLVPRYGAAAVVSPLLEKQATDALAVIKIANAIAVEAPIRAEFLFGRGRGRANVKTGVGI